MKGGVKLSRTHKPIDKKCLNNIVTVNTPLL